MTGVRRSHSEGWHDARTIAAHAAWILTVQTVPLDQAIGRILAADMLALTDVPHYASSAMDGWAVCGAGPWQLVDSALLTHGTATVIVTGGVIPRHADAVLRSESGTARGGLLTASGPTGEPHPGQHMRPTGGEARQGDTVVLAGALLNPAHIALAAGCGRDDLPVIARPRVRLLLTGDEIDDSGLPGPGRVRDSFGPQLPAVLRLLGGDVTSQRRVRDDYALTVAALVEDPLSADLIISTGGTGGSASDHLRAAIDYLGAELLVPRVAMRPGGPTMLARLSDGRLLIGLPGNPLAAMMGLLTLAAPILAVLGGAPIPDHGIPDHGIPDHGSVNSGLVAAGFVVSAAALDGRAGTSLLVPFRFDNGRAVANSWLGSGMMRGLADAAGVLVVPPHGVREGETVQTLALPWLSPRNYG